MFTVADYYIRWLCHIQPPDTIYSDLKWLLLLEANATAIITHAKQFLIVSIILAPYPVVVVVHIDMNMHYRRQENCTDNHENCVYRYFSSINFSSDKAHWQKKATRASPYFQFTAKHVHIQRVALSRLQCECDCDLRCTINTSDSIEYIVPSEMRSGVQTLNSWSNVLLLDWAMQIQTTYKWDAVDVF